MEHVAIMKKSWGLTRKILSGEKTIESRWYRFRRLLGTALTLETSFTSRTRANL